MWNLFPEPFSGTGEPLCGTLMWNPYLEPSPNHPKPFLAKTPSCSSCWGKMIYSIIEYSIWLIIYIQWNLSKLQNERKSISSSNTERLNCVLGKKGNRCKIHIYIYIYAGERRAATPPNPNGMVHQSQGGGILRGLFGLETFIWNIFALI